MEKYKTNKEPKFTPEAIQKVRIPERVEEMNVQVILYQIHLLVVVLFVGFEAFAHI